MPLPGVATGQNTAQQELWHQAQQVWTMLDEMAEKNPETYKIFIDKQMKEASQDLGNRNPSAELCVRTRLKNEICYLFVEVFSWQLIRAPQASENPTQEELCAHLTDVEYHTNSTGDKKSARLMLVMNPEVIEKLRPTNNHSSSEQRHLMQNILELIQKEIGTSLETDSFEFLDKTACTGDPVKLRNHVFNLSKKQENSPSTTKRESVLERLTNIKIPGESDDENKDFVSPLVKLGDKTTSLFKTEETEQSTKQTTKHVLIREISNKTVHPIEPRYEIQRSQENWVIVDVHLPGVKSGGECEVDLIEDVLTVEVGNRYSLLLPLDAKIDESKASADFSAKSATLTIKVPMNNST